MFYSYYTNNEVTIHMMVARTIFHRKLRNYYYLKKNLLVMKLTQQKFAVILFGAFPVERTSCRTQSMKYSCPEMMSIASLWAMIRPIVISTEQHPFIPYHCISSDNYGKVSCCSFISIHLPICLGSFN